MSYEEILQRLAPCGLNCTKCLMHEGGEIRATAGRLKDLLGSFDRYAERFSSFMPVFRNYPQFKDLLAHFTTGDCKGCRKGMCRYPGCIVPSCSRERGVDFCFQCSEFPCTRITFDPDLRRRWLEMNTRMKEVGVEAFYAETRDLPRYR